MLMTLMSDQLIDIRTASQASADRSMAGTATLLLLAGTSCVLARLALQDPQDPQDLLLKVIPPGNQLYTVENVYYNSIVL